MAALALALLAGCTLAPPDPIRPASDVPSSLPPAQESSLASTERVIPPQAQDGVSPAESPQLPAEPAAPEPRPVIPEPTAEAPPEPQAPQAAPVAPAAPANAEGQTGIASYYADWFNGRPTTTGAIYDPEKLTAAHQSLPFGTKVKVVNLSNGREVVVTVNDRCRKRKFPFIDLSRAAAKQLRFFGKGITKVRIIPLPATSAGPTR